ncbi:hypothetical protein GDO78_018542 [Eleutherodactylus coqui]|uniref:Uncharacterized protein n=1 Tax=Eleutherodactylus coqui TaxID=57060 RepID=A0A8J6B8U3_ELECQ|nr:hypothetical protein GDO78_018542 [Eleutherodactylus coqui]
MPLSLFPHCFTFYFGFHLWDGHHAVAMTQTAPVTSVHIFLGIFTTLKHILGRRIVFCFLVLFRLVSCSSNRQKLFLFTKIIKN